jgi:hypothetical protein
MAAACSGVKPAVKRTCRELQSIGTGSEPSGLAKPCPSADAAKVIVRLNAVSSSAANLGRKATF